MPERGFTLLEIMLVIFLIGLASSGVVQTFATDSEPPAKKAAQDFLTRFAQFKDRAVIEGQTLGVLIDAPGYQFMQRRQGSGCPFPRPGYRHRLRCQNRCRCCYNPEVISGRRSMRWSCNVVA